jgi:polysaccharide deacetylase family protein (PEP-CTERM system associated)
MPLPGRRVASGGVGAEITFTLDLEDNREAPGLPERFVDAARMLLDVLEERAIRGTVFVVGELAGSHPELVRAAAAQGHEIGLHGHRHLPLPELGPAELGDDLRRGKAALEDLTGAPVVGFRAPYFSLTPQVPHVPDLLAEAGFTYSSSVLPATSPLYGWRGAPVTPFRWPSGVLELPVPVAAIAGRGLPFLGGVYLRLLPPPVVRAALATAGRRLLLWTYCHPYDFDDGEPFRVLPDLGPLKSRLLWRNRDRMAARLAGVVSPGARPLAERVAAGVEAAAAPPALPPAAPPATAR